MPTLPKLQRFEEQVLSKYQIYNSIFMTLPFDKINNTGVLLPLFNEVCKAGFANGNNPTEIVTHFITRYLDKPTEQEQIDILFRFIQYIERQVVLFDAIEDATFSGIHNMEGIGTLRSMKERAVAENKMTALQEELAVFKVRPVLTAHPTQFYPGNVLAIITDLAKAIKENNLVYIQKLLAQLGKTPFFKQKKPTPYDEAVSLIWYLENVFYHSISSIYNYIQHNVFEGKPVENELVSIGFWPGGDRDGNPFVTTEITLKVAERLRQTIIKNYYRDLREVKRRLTFKGVEEILVNLEQKLLKYSNEPLSENFSTHYLLTELAKARTILVAKHQSLFLSELDDLINKINLFGFHFATMDIRQDSSVHRHVFEMITKDKEVFSTLELLDDVPEEDQLYLVSNLKGKLNPTDYSDDEQTQKTIASIYALKEIQKYNGELGCNRYIISNTQTAMDIMSTFAMLNLCDFNEGLTVDVVPLFETVLDLENAATIMRLMYENNAYNTHLTLRGNKQTIMLGFSDGTKDGGYLMSNWGIFKAKEALTAVSREFNIDVVFFDGRGGPPARGGGKTHQFYASLGDGIAAKEIQLTIQGQTISSKFGTLDSSQYNLEQLVSAGITNTIFENKGNIITLEDRQILENLAKTSYEAYVAFKKHDKFIPYLENMSTLKYYAKANIGSRPSKRSKSKELIFSDLRAIPFVGSWSQLKQNVPGFYGIGTALNVYKEKGAFDKVKSLYNNSNFFRVLLENSMMSLTKSFFELTAYMAEDEEYGDFWKLIHQEYELSKKLLLELAGYEELMQNDPATKASILVRDDIVLPLLTIQQFALKKIQELRNTDNKALLEIYENMVTRSLFGNINASRNSA
jgi:phosphoenolpyruvate carboxylase